MSEQPDKYQVVRDWSRPIGETTPLVGPPRKYQTLRALAQVFSGLAWAAGGIGGVLALLWIERWNGPGWIQAAILVVGLITAAVLAAICEIIKLVVNVADSTERTARAAEATRDRLGASEVEVVQR